MRLVRYNHCQGRNGDRCGLLLTNLLCGLFATNQKHSVEIGSYYQRITQLGLFISVTCVILL